MKRFRLILMLAVAVNFASCGDDEGGNMEQFNVTDLDLTKAKVGTTINVIGTGFGEAISDIAVIFGDDTAQVLSVSPTNIQVTVPNGSTFGPLKVTLMNIAATNKPNFTTENYIDERDQMDYPLVYINNQVWLAKNLNFESETDHTCYEEDENNCIADGRFYTRTSAITVCPDGWVLPSDLDFDELLLAVDFDRGRVLRDGGESGFDIVLSGIAQFNNEDELVYSMKDELSHFWTNTIDESDDLSIIFQYFPGTNDFYSKTVPTNYACVRCIKK